MYCYGTCLHVVPLPTESENHHTNCSCFAGRESWGVCIDVDSLQWHPRLFCSSSALRWWDYYGWLPPKLAGNCSWSLGFPLHRSSGDSSVAKNIQWEALYLVSCIHWVRESSHDWIHLLSHRDIDRWCWCRRGPTRQHSMHWHWPQGW